MRRSAITDAVEELTYGISEIGTAMSLPFLDEARAERHILELQHRRLVRERGRLLDLKRNRELLNENKAMFAEIQALKLELGIVDEPPVITAEPVESETNKFGLRKLSESRARELDVLSGYRSMTQDYMSNS